MAYAFKKLEPVAFGDLVVMPKLTAEIKLRIRQFKVTETNMDELRDLLSQCFESAREEVKGFMRDNFSDIDYMRLQAYLLDGEKGVADLERRMDTVVTETMKEAING